jgi:hypothetical protein
MDINVVNEYAQVQKSISDRNKNSSTPGKGISDVLGKLQGGVTDARKDKAELQMRQDTYNKMLEHAKNKK